MRWKKRIRRGYAGRKLVKEEEEQGLKETKECKSTNVRGKEDKKNGRFIVEEEEIKVGVEG